MTARSGLSSSIRPPETQQGPRTWRGALGLRAVFFGGGQPARSLRTIRSTFTFSGGPGLGVNRAAQAARATEGNAGNVGEIPQATNPSRRGEDAPLAPDVRKRPFRTPLPIYTILDLFTARSRRRLQGQRLCGLPERLGGGPESGSGGWAIIRAESRRSANLGASAPGARRRWPAARSACRPAQGGAKQTIFVSEQPHQNGQQRGRAAHHRTVADKLSHGFSPLGFPWPRDRRAMPPLHGQIIPFPISRAARMAPE